MSFSNVSIAKLSTFEENPIKTKVDIVNFIPTLAAKAGEERTVREILPILDALVTDDEEISLPIASAADFLCGFFEKEESLCLVLPCLKNLGEHENQTVREKAVDAMVKIACKLGEENFEKHVFESILKPYNGSPYASSKLSMLRLVFLLYKKGKTMRGDFALLNLFCGIGDCENPLIKKCALKSVNICLPEIMKNEDQENFLISYRNYLFDEFDSVKFAAIRTLPSVIENLKVDIKNNFVFETINELQLDSSWRTRRVLCDNLENIAKNLDENSVNTKILSLLFELLEDREIEVVLSAARMVKKLTKYFNEKSLTEKLIPKLEEIIKKEHNIVSRELAQNLGITLAAIPTEQVEKIFPRVVDVVFSKGEETILKFILNLGRVKKSDSTAHCFELIKNKFSDLSYNSDWRVRFDVVHYMPFLLDAFGKDSFEPGYFSLSLVFLHDRTSVVRQKTAECIKELCLRLGSKWIVSDLMPELYKLLTNQSYLLRVSAIKVLVKLAGLLEKREKSEFEDSSGTEAFDTSLINDLVLPALESGLKDKIYNVRYTTAVGLEYLLEKDLVGTEMKTRIENSLKEFRAEQEKEVFVFKNEVESAK